MDAFQGLLHADGGDRRHPQYSLEILPRPAASTFHGHSKEDEGRRGPKKCRRVQNFSKSDAGACEWAQRGRGCMQTKAIWAFHARERWEYRCVARPSAEHSEPLLAGTQHGRDSLSGARAAWRRVSVNAQQVTADAGAARGGTGPAHFGGGSGWRVHCTIMRCKRSLVEPTGRALLCSALLDKGIFIDFGVPVDIVLCGQQGRQQRSVTPRKRRERARTHLAHSHHTGCHVLTRV